MDNILTCFCMRLSRRRFVEGSMRNVTFVALSLFFFMAFVRFRLACRGVQGASPLNKSTNYHSDTAYWWTGDGMYTHIDGSLTYEQDPTPCFLRTETCARS